MLQFDSIPEMELFQENCIYYTCKNIVIDLICMSACKVFISHFITLFVFLKILEKIEPKFNVPTIIDR